MQYFFKDPQYDPQLLICPPPRKAKAEKKSDKQVILKNLQALQIFLQSLDLKKFVKDELEKEIKNFITQENMKTGEVLWPLRVALSGLEASPGPFEIMDAFGALPNGKEIILKRLSAAAEKLF